MKRIIVETMDFQSIGIDFGSSAGHAHDYVAFSMRILERALANLHVLPKTTIETPEELSQLVSEVVEGLQDQ